MSPLFGQANQHSLQSLDELGQIAAVYPSEDQLWLYGPTITDPSGQGVEGITTYGMGEHGADAYPVIPVPTSPQEVQVLEDWLHEQINGQTPNGAYAEDWVNLDVGGPPGYGNFNEQPFYSGHSQIVQSNPASEQGWGVGPARRWAHYPFAELGNPARNAANHLRMGQLPWSYPEQNMLYYRTQLIWEQQWDAYKQRLPVNPVVPVMPSVPFSQTVPVYGGGDVVHPGVGSPYLISDDHGAGIY